VSPSPEHLVEIVQYAGEDTEVVWQEEYVYVQAHPAVCDVLLAAAERGVTLRMVVKQNQLWLQQIKCGRTAGTRGPWTRRRRT
jgi:hypothetical protein